MLKRAIVTPDKHFPLHDPEAISCVNQAIEIVKPDIYIDLGDTGEWSYFSTHYWKGKFAKPMEDLIPLLDQDVAEVYTYYRDQTLDKSPGGSYDNYGLIVSEDNINSVAEL